MIHHCNPEAEVVLIGSILNRNNILAEAGGLLVPEDFALKANEVIFREMLKMYQDGIGIDYHTLANHMKPEALKVAGGLTYLVKAHQAPATLLNYRDHIKEVKRKSDTRKLLNTLTEALTLTEADDPEKVIEYLQGRIIENQSQGRSGVKPVHEILHEILNGEPESTIMTGFTTLDRALKGLRPGRVLTIAGRPGTGKTAFSLRLLDQFPDSERAVYFSLEMDEVEIVQRLASARTFTKLDNIINKTLTHEEEEKIRNSKLSKPGNVSIEDSSGMTINRIKALARIEKIKHGLSVIFVDHIGLLNPSTPGMKSYERMTEISKGLKELAKELDITVIALSQLNRAPDSRNNGEPLLSDLRDSGSIEQDSDQVILLYNPDYQEQSGQSISKTNVPETLIAKVAKNRSGGIGKISFDYYKDTQYIQEQRR